MEHYLIYIFHRNPKSDLHHFQHAGDFTDRHSYVQALLQVALLLFHFYYDFRILSSQISTNYLFYDRLKKLVAHWQHHSKFSFRFSQIYYCFDSDCNHRYCQSLSWCSVVVSSRDDCIDLKDSSNFLHLMNCIYLKVFTGKTGHKLCLKIFSFDSMQFCHKCPTLELLLETDCYFSGHCSVNLLVCGCVKTTHP